MGKLDMSQDIFGKVDTFGWWDMERIQTDASMQFTSEYFQESLSIHALQLILQTSYHQEMNGQAGVPWRTLQTIIHSIMVHARVL